MNKRKTMKINTTHHYIKKSKERLPQHDQSFIDKTFEYILHLIKKNKLQPTQGNTSTTNKVKYKGLTYIFTDNNFLITIY